MNTENANRRKSVITILAIISMLVFFMVLSMNTYADNGDSIVHITRSGDCYHSAHCSYLKSDIEITLYEATKAGYRRCSRCNPPIYDGGTEKYTEPQANSFVDTNLEITAHDTSDVSPKSTPASIEVTTAFSENIDDIIKNVPTNSTVSSSYVSSATSASDTTSKSSATIAKSSVDNPNKVSANAKEATKTDDSDSSFILLAICGAVGLIFYKFYKNNKDEQKNQKQSDEQEKYETERQRYYVIYAGKNPLDLVNVPDGTFLKDGFPCTRSADNSLYGDYTVYVGEKSFSTFHFNPHCGGATLRPTNYYSAHLLQHCPKCATGKIKLPQLEWYMKYIEIKQIKEKYNIP